MLTLSQLKMGLFNHEENELFIMAEIFHHVHRVQWAIRGLWPGQ